jgi:hypothetical protein
LLLISSPESRTSRAQTECSIMSITTRCCIHTTTRHHSLCVLLPTHCICSQTARVA